MCSFDLARIVRESNLYTYFHSEGFLCFPFNTTTKRIVVGGWNMLKAASRCARFLQHSPFSQSRFVFRTTMNKVSYQIALISFFNCSYKSVFVCFAERISSKTSISTQNITNNKNNKRIKYVSTNFFFFALFCDIMNDSNGLCNAVRFSSPSLQFWNKKFVIKQMNI